VLLEATNRIPAHLWTRGVLYPDPDGREVFASRTNGTLWRSGLYKRYVRWVSADDAVHHPGSSGPYGSPGYTTGPSWGFTLLDDGRVTRLLGDVDKIKQRIIKMVLDQR
jgi:hypothetical protein